MMKLDKFKSIVNKIKLKELRGNKIVRYLIVLCVTTISIMIITIAQKNSDLNKLVTEAERHYYAQEYDLAIAKYGELSKKDVTSPKWNLKIAEIYSVMNDLDNSLKYIDLTKEYEELDASSYNHMVFTEFMNGEYEQALKDGNLALVKYPKDKSLIKTMFTVYMGNNKITEAKEIISGYEVDIQSSYDTAEYSEMLMLIGKLDEGYSKLKLAYELNKDEYKIYDVLAQISLYDKDILLENITALSKNNPNDLAYKMWLAKIYSLSIDTVDEANKLIEEISGKDIGDIQIKLIKANVYKNMDDTEKSDKLIEDVISEYPDDYGAYHSGGWYYLYKGDYEMASEYCRKSIQNNSEYTDNYGFLMPEILKHGTSKIAAEPYYRTALNKEPYNYNIMLSIANYYWHTSDDIHKALEYFNFASIIKPYDVEIKYNMALIKIFDGKGDEAIEILNMCSKLDGSVPKYHRTLATVYMTQSKVVEAKAEIKSAYDADEEDILTLNNTGCYYISAEQNVEKGLENIKKAFQGLNNSYDEYTKKIIVENYDKVQKLKQSYETGKDNEELEIPEFTLFY
ncbi:tetratricopeptide repeat protein [Clostridium sp.]|uniref:tetratricopeptide repeat protein n=1 Tax=Clostridium sp. TaxID=1506 RepID=UPI003F4B8394